MPGAIARKKTDPGETSAFERGLKLLTVRERSEHELRARLKREGFGEVDVDDAVAQLISMDYLSDARYAECYLRTKLAAGWGVPRIRRDLEREGIALEDVEGWPEEFGEDDEMDRARAALEHAHFNSKNPQASAYRRLISKGFSGEVASRCAYEYAQTANTRDGR